MNWLRNLLKGAYTRHLEEECARLRAENRGLLNSLLQTTGHAPIAEPEAAPEPAPEPRKLPARGMSWHQRQMMTERQSEQRMIERARIAAQGPKDAA